LAGRLVALRKESTAELSGPCPKCGGGDRFHVKADLFFCRQCYPLENGKPHDAIEFVTWAGLAHDFRGAVDYLGGRALPSPAVIRRAPMAPSPKPAAWKAQDWQDATRRELAAAVTRLASPAGDPGAEYLLRRGILPETWQAWGFGYGEAWDPKLQRRRPAILIPWQRDQVTAIKYRFTDQIEGGLRYTSKTGGQCIAFGLQMAGQHWSTLWLIEGELNALSLWQALRAEYCVNFDVVSFGGDSQAAHLDPVVKAWAGKYQQVIVWADDPDKALAAMRALPGTFGLFGLRSPEVDGRKLDANELLKLGGLADFALAAWDRFDKDLAYIGRLQAAIEALPGLERAN
jgi:cation transport regulator ChaC